MGSSKIDWKKFKNEKQKKKGTCYNYGQRPLCKRMSQKETKLKEQIQRFLTSSNNKQN